MLSFLRLACACLILPGLSACLAGQGPGAFAPEPEAQAFNFDWSLSGEPRVGPLQVFDNGVRTWLHFAPGQIVPAVFGRRAGREQALVLTPVGQFHLSQGVWPELLFRAGHGQARASRHADRPAGEPPPSTLAAAPGAAVQPGAPLVVRAAAALQEQPAVPAAVPALSPSYDIRPEDQTLRQALARWAGLAGWVFQPDHWDLDVDLPVSAPARFQGDFKTAVQQLLHGTELTAYPAQPCFYSNQVLRVVAWSQACDRSLASGERS
ncbi:TcpQ domain-containing protein [Alcaligenes sp. WGS1538]|uniref:TcpQ domain-containing protein n=1 Tax=Alcaligenes sp. WGS1538 TaxID=3366811 RepID=UPI00372D4E78